MRSRVIPGSSVTIERRCPIRRLNRADLPTFGRPAIAISGRPSISETFLKIARLILWDLRCLERCYNAVQISSVVWKWSLITEFGKESEAQRGSLLELRRMFLFVSL